MGKCEIKINIIFNITGPESMIKLLIENGADVNAVGFNGSTALTWATYNGKNSLSH